jgi:Uma2 family endonuclease
MSPAPTWRHQDISSELITKFRIFLKGKPCKAFHAPFDVILNPGEHDDIVVQPDLGIVCDKSKLENGKNCVGVPDMLVEILSPSTLQHDRFVKFNLYRKYGVKEYWIIDPEARYIEVFILKNGEYVRSVFGETAIVAVQTLPGLEINLADIFGAEE